MHIHNTQIQGNFYCRHPFAEDFYIFSKNLRHLLRQYFCRGNTNLAYISLRKSHRKLLRESSTTSHGTRQTSAQHVGFSAAFVRHRTIFCGKRSSHEARLTFRITSEIFLDASTSLYGTRKTFHVTRVIFYSTPVFSLVPFSSAIR